MKNFILVMSLVVGTSAFANPDCRVSVSPGKKHLPESFTSALEKKNYEIVSKRDAAIAIEIVHVLPGFVGGKVDVTHRKTGFRKSYAMMRKLGDPDPRRAVYARRLSNANSVSEYQAITDEILNTTFNDIPDGPLEISMPSCADFYGKEVVNN